MTCDPQDVVHGGGENFLNMSAPSSYYLCLKDSEQKDHLINELINCKGVNRTGPATPSLLKNPAYGRHQLS